MKKQFQSPAFIISTVICVLGIVLLTLQSNSFSGVLFFLPFSLGPILLNVVFALSLNSKPAQITIISGSVLYSIWFAFIYLSAFHWYVDAQSGIALLFVGLYSLPVMFPLWIVAHSINTKNQKKA